MSLVSLCLYKNENGTSYIGLPQKHREGDKDVYSCRLREDSLLIGMFYIINPDIRPIPPGMDLLCIKNTETSIPETVGIEPIYDPFNIDNQCTRMIAWMEPVPYGKPLYIYKKGSSVSISFEKEELEQLSFSPIYVLEKEYGFKGVQGRCMPDPNGDSLYDCIMYTVKDILGTKPLKQPTLLSYLDNQEEKQKGHVYWVVIVCVVFLCIVFYYCFIKKWKGLI